jgi:hypothetical protein
MVLVTAGQVAWIAMAISMFAAIGARTVADFAPVHLAAARAAIRVFEAAWNAEDVPAMTSAAGTGMPQQLAQQATSA